MTITKEQLEQAEQVLLRNSGNPQSAALIVLVGALKEIRRELSAIEIRLGHIEQAIANP